MKQDREAIRILVADIGYQETAKRTGIAYATLRQWSKRGKWNVTPTHAQAVTSVTRSLGEVHAEAIAENERETRLSLSKYARKASKDSENASLRDSPYVHKAAQVAGIAFKWDAKEREQSNVVVNIALLGVEPSEVQATARELDSGVSE